MSLLVESLHMRVDSEMVIGVQELASAFICRGFSIIFPFDNFVHYYVSEYFINLPRSNSS